MSDAALDALARLWEHAGGKNHGKLIEEVDRTTPNWRREPPPPTVDPKGVHRTLVAWDCARKVLREAGRL